MKDEALRMALEAFYFDELPLTQQNVDAWDAVRSKAITAIRAALEAPVQEPVACLSKSQAKAILDLALELEKTGRLVSLTEGQERSDFVARNRNIQCALEDALRNATTPPAAQRPWVGLTDKERNHARNTVTYSPLAMTHGEWAKAVQVETERRLKEKNHD
jgi:hypothetical protein